MDTLVYTKSWTRKGQRVNKVRARNHKWGEGKVHWVLLIAKDDKRNVEGFRYYVKACVQNAESSHWLGGSDWGNVPKDEPVTCKKCLNYEKGA